VFARVPSAETGRALLLGLCRPAGSGPAVRRRANLTELLTAAGPGGLAALEVLAGGGLVLVDAEADVVELAHDVLLTTWARLRDWIADETADSGLRRHLAQAASAWAAGGRESGRLYRGARLVTVLDWAERHGSQLSTVEREFLAAGNRLVLAAETRRKRRTVLLWKWLAATVLVAILAVAVAVVAVTMQLRAAQSADKADAARVATAAIAEPDPRLALLLAVAAARLDATATGTVREVLARAADLMATAGDRVSAVAVSPDGRTIAAGETAGPIRLLDPRTLAVAATLDYPGHAPVTGLAFTADGHRLVSWGRGEDASIVVWDLASRRPTGSAFGQPWPGGGGLLADRTTLVVAQHAANAPAIAAAWSVEARTPSTVYPLPPAAVDSVLVSPDGRLVVLGSAAGSLVLEPATGVARTVPAARLPLAVSADGHTLLAAEGTDVVLWDIETAQARAAHGHKGQPLAAAWAPDGRRFASVADDGTVIVWDATTLQAVRSYAGGRLALRSVVFAPDGTTLYTAGDDGGLLVWDLTGTRGLASRLGADNAVALACTVAGRDLTADEWHRFLPDRPARAVCAA
jgi:DNA-binding beta-propeller fold protein YncE